MAETEILDIVLTVISFIAAGVLYSASGFVQRIRRKLSDETVTLDYRKMGKAVALGVILGIAAFFMGSLSGDPVPDLYITGDDGFDYTATMKALGIQIGLHAASIMLVDKWLLGRSGPPTNTLKDEDFDLEDDGEDLPPAKGEGDGKI